MKSDRQKAIMDLISSYEIETQKQLQDALAQRGFPCTQATLSRDIKELHLQKVRMGNDRLKYAREVSGCDEAQMQRLFRVSHHGMLSFDVAQNLIVIRTLPGLAAGVCSYIDELQLSQVVGSIAGNDTVLLVVKSADTVPGVIRAIREVMSQK